MSHRLSAVFLFGWSLLASPFLFLSSAHAACETPNLLLVLDNSCSMNGLKWTSAVGAINSITTTQQHSFRFGLGNFNSTATIAFGIDECVQSGTSCPTLLQRALATLYPAGGTDLVAGVQTAQAHLTKIRQTDPVKNRKMSVMFITDGQAECAHAEVATLFQHLGVQTFVVGFGSGVDSDCLNRMALAGQTAISGPGRKYYQADNPTELHLAMTAIANAASTEICNDLDDDCDGRIDNLHGTPDPLSRTCTGSCGQGTQTCSKGTWQPCTAERNPSPETCNRQDDDCDGKIDEGVCIQFCQGGTCSGYPGEPCAGITCTTEQICRNGLCIQLCSATKPCPTGQLCASGICQADPCFQVECPIDHACSKGECHPSKTPSPRTDAPSLPDASPFPLGPAPVGSSNPSNAPTTGCSCSFGRSFEHLPFYFLFLFFLLFRSRRLPSKPRNLL